MSPQPVDINPDSTAEDPIPHAVGPTTINGSPVRGPIIVGMHAGQAVIWQIDLLGTPCGAWVKPYEGSSTARELLAKCDRRAIVTTNPVGAVNLLVEWAKDGDVPVDQADLRTRICSIPTLLDEVAKARHTYTTEVRDKEQREGKRLAALNWEVDIPGQVPTTFQALLDCASVNTHTASPEVARVLITARLAQWAIRTWTNTESIRVRRPYLREPFGPAQPLPPSWRAAVTSAYDAPFIGRLGLCGDDG